jgi:hypothetical protein
MTQNNPKWSGTSETVRNCLKESAQNKPKRLSMIPNGLKQPVMIKKDPKWLVKTQNSMKQSETAQRGLERPSTRGGTIPKHIFFQAEITVENSIE